MSWFSDFAKSALNEAQKHIDKVLDIEDDGSGGASISDSSYKLGESKTLKAIDKPKVSAPQKSSFSSATSPSARLNFSAGQSKKRSKTPKLGSSLTRKSSDGKPTFRLSDASSKNVAKSDVSVFEEISLEISNDQTSQKQDDLLTEMSDKHDSITDSSSHLPVCEDDSIPFREKDNTLIFEPEKEIAFAAIANAESVTDVEEPKFDQTSPVHEVVNHDDTQTSTSESPRSPCGSTTASSEIEILDHESSVSEASAVLKYSEFEPRFHYSGSRVSPDQVESEASDFGRISGYCSSPLSVGSNEGATNFIPQPRLSNLAENHYGSFRMKKVLVVASKVNEDHTIRAEILQRLSLFSVATVLEDDVTYVHFVDNEDIKSEMEENVTLCDSVETIVKISMENQDMESPLQSDSQTTITDIATEKSDSTVLVSPNSDSPTPPELTNECNLSNGDVIVPTTVNKQEINVEEIADQTNEEPRIEVDESPPAVPVDEIPISKSVENSEEQLQKEAKSKEIEKFEVYEQQLLTLSLSNAKLNEENDNLRSEIRNLKVEHDQDFDEQQENLLKTVENLSIKIQGLELEKSEISSHLMEAQADLSTRLSNEQVQHLIAEKEESIQGLLEEGEVLSKKHLQLNTTIKKLRSKLQDRESSVKDLKESVEKVKEENKSLKSHLTEIQGQSSEDRGAAKRLSEAYQEREAELNGMRSRLEEAEEKKRSAQSTLDAAYKDLAELNKKLAALQSDREAELRDNESLVTKRMQQEMDKLRQEHEHKMHMRLLQIGELQDAIERNEAVYSRKEDQLRKEVKDLQQRLQESEMRNHELSETISESTRPILRQMENLQNTYSTRAKTWEALEKSLTARLGDAQVQLVASQEKERSLQMQAVDLKSRVTTLEQQLNESRSEKAQINSELEVLRSNAEKYDEKVEKIRKELESSVKECDEVRSKARRDRLTLENQLDMEKVRAEVEKKKFSSQLEALQKEKERILWMNRSDSVVSSASALNADAESTASSGDTFNNLDVFERQTSSSGLGAGVYDSVRVGTNNSAVMENLQSQLKMRDGEIAQLQGEINTLERTRSSMAEEIVRLTNENEDLNETTKDVQDLKRKLQETEARYEAVLTMYGEKAEEAEELRLDLEDVKSMYRNQIDTLLKCQ